MDASTKKKLLAAAAGLSVMTASPAAGQEPVAPVKIGVMDLEVKGLAFSDSNTMIEYQAFTPEGATEGKQTTRDRKSVVSGTSVSVRVDLGGRRIMKKKNNKKQERRI